MLVAISSWATVFAVEYFAEICEKRRKCVQKKWKQLRKGEVSFHSSCALISPAELSLFIYLFILLCYRKRAEVTGKHLNSTMGKKTSFSGNKPFVDHVNIFMQLLPYAVHATCVSG